MIPGPHSNNRFLVEIEGLTAAGFTSATLPEGVIDAVAYREGGDSSALTRSIPVRRRLGHLILARGVTDNRELADWFEHAAGGQLEDRGGAITLLDENGAQVARWNFQGAWPVRYSLSPLDAQGNAVMTETIELALESFSRA